MMESKVIGKVFLINGNVQVVSENNVTRTAMPNDPIYYGDRIITGAGDSVSLQFINGNHMELGRLSDVTLNGEGFLFQQSQDIQGEVAQLQQALLQDEEFDPTIDLTTAAGAAAELNGGGSRDFVKFELDNMEVLPESGAETVGISRQNVDQEAPVLEAEQTESNEDSAEVVQTVADQEVSIAVAPAAAVQPSGEEIQEPGEQPTTAGDTILDFSEMHLAAGSAPDSDQLLVSGVLSDLGVTISSTSPGILDFGNGNILELDGDGTELVLNGSFGVLTIADDGSWSFEASQNVAHPEESETVSDIFNFTVMNPDNGAQASGSLTVNLDDDQPTANCYVDFVNDVTSGNIIAAIEDDLFTPRGLPEDAVGADQEGKITSITYVDEDGVVQTVDVPEGENGVTVDTQYGELHIEQDGDYEYTVDSITGFEDFARGSTPVDEATLYAFNIGTSYVDAHGNLVDLATNSDGVIGSHGNGAGINGGSYGPSSQITHDPSQDLSEALAVHFESGPVNSVTFKVSNLYQNEGPRVNGDRLDETGAWEAFDEDGNSVGSGIIDNSTLENRSPSHRGEMTITEEDLNDGASTFQTIVFTSTYYGDGNGNPVINTTTINDDDSSDYFLKEIGWRKAEEEPGTEDKIEFTVEDSDGDTDTGSITFEISNDPEGDTEALADDLELDADTDGPLPNLDGCPDMGGTEEELDVLVPDGGDMAV